MSVAKSPKGRFIIANITWNPYGWRSPYVDPRAGHSYAKKYPGHESLNFDFNKKGIDNTDTVHGYVQWTGSPSLSKDGVVFFYSKNLDGRRNEIVGVYGDAKIIDPKIEIGWKGFEGGKVGFNLLAKKRLSLLFPIPLDSDKYRVRKRLVPRAGFTYVKKNLAERIVEEEFEKLRLSGTLLAEQNKLEDLYYFISGKKLIPIEAQNTRRVRAKRD